MFDFSNAIHHFMCLIGRSLQTQPPNHTENDKFVVARPNNNNNDNDNANKPSISIDVIAEMDHFHEVNDAIEAKTHEMLLTAISVLANNTLTTSAAANETANTPTDQAVDLVEAENPESPMDMDTLIIKK
jgi:hypothetical protein